MLSERGNLPDAIDVVETAEGAVTFRRGAMADVPAALAYINALSREQTYILMQGEQLTLAEELAFFGGLMSKMASGDAVQIVAMAGDELIGIAQTGREPRVFAHVARLGISIAQEWRGMGLGRRLMEILLAETERTMPGIEAIQLEMFRKQSGGDRAVRIGWVPGMRPDPEQDPAPGRIGRRSDHDAVVDSAW